MWRSTAEAYGAGRLAGPRGRDWLSRRTDCGPYRQGVTATDTTDRVALGCARDFEIAQRADMESFGAYDARTFRDGHHPEAVTIFASGARRIGIDSIMEALAPHFERRTASWRWVELHRFVDGCRNAYIIYETWYDDPSRDVSLHQLTAATYVRDRGRWLAIADQGTILP